VNILDKIVQTKRKEIVISKREVPVKQLEQEAYFTREIYSMSGSLRAKMPCAIIAEFKRRSPSKGNIFNEAQVVPVVQSYAEAGCAGISVLTDTDYFGGSLDDLRRARAAVQLPLLRKDFIVDEYQILEARSAGADLILLIAEVLTEKEVLHLAKFARSLGLEVLLEMHSEEGVSKINEYVNIVGINNRNLKTFEVDIEASIRLLNNLKGDFIKISESGLSEPATVHRLSAAGFGGFLVGENFMKTRTPGRACSQFIAEVLHLENLAT
jgi:indole-3-glycerol phosphate synthase